MPLSSSTVLNERYELQELIAQGGSGEVWRAWDREVGIERAIKVLHSVDSVARRRLQREARAMATIGHAHILPVYDLRSSDGVLYIVMRLATESLNDRLGRLGTLPAGEAVRATIDVLDALHAAHTVGVIHRDVKPHNVLIDDNGDVMLADFGVAKLERDKQHLTQTQAMLGSLAYMPPEQRLDPTTVDAAADRYAAGAMLYQLVTGDSPMDLFAEAPSSSRWRSVPKVLRPALQTACSADPSDRFQGTLQMADALRSTLPTLEPASRTIPWRWIAVLVVSLALFAAIGTQLLRPAPAAVPAKPHVATVAEPHVAQVAEPVPSKIAEPVPAEVAEPTVEATPADQPHVAPHIVPESTPPAPPPAGPPSTLHGRWRGSLDGYPATLRVSGPNDSMTGQLTSRDTSHDLSGRLNDRRALLTGSTGALDLQLVDGRLIGTWSPERSHEVLPISMGLAP